MLLPLLVVTIGTIDVSRMMVSRVMLSYAAICGARAAVLKNTASAGAVQTVVTSAAPMLPLTNADVTVGYTSASWAARTSGDIMTVTAVYTFTPVLGNLTLLATKTFTATSVETIP